MLIDQCTEWKKICGGYPIVSTVSEARARNAVITEVTPLPPKELNDWLLYDKHRNDFQDWMPYFTRFPGHEIRAYYVNVNPDSASYNNYLVMRCRDPIVFIDEFSDVPVSSASFEE